MGRATVEDAAPTNDVAPAEAGEARAAEHGPASAISPRRRVLLILGIGVLAGAALFLGASFHLLQGQSSAERQVVTTASGVDADHRLPRGRNVDLYVLGEPALAENLAGYLRVQLESNPYLGQITTRPPPASPATEGALVVEVTSRSVFWTPFYSRAELRVEASYASDGAVGWRDQPGAVMSESPAARMHGAYVVRDSSAGLMSLPGYRDYLDTKIAAEIGESLEAALAGLAR